MSAATCGSATGTLLERMNRAGNFFAGLGVRRGERVALLLMDTPEFFYCYFGAIKIGAVAVPVNPFQKPKDCFYVLKDSAARVVVVERRSCWRNWIGSAGRLAGIERRRRCWRGAGRLYFFERRAGFCFGVARSGSYPARMIRLFGFILPGVLARLRLACICIGIWWFARSFMRENILRMNESDRCYSVARLYFAYGLGNAGYFPLAAGATTILSPARPSPAGIYADVEKLPAYFVFFCAFELCGAFGASCGENGREFDFSSVRHAVSAGESLPAPLFERFKERFGVEILDSLGSTETLQMVIANAPGDVRPGSSGKVIPGYEAKIVDENGGVGGARERLGI